MNTRALHANLAGALWRVEASNPWLRGIILAVLGAALIWVSAKVKVPMWPVPMTMQTFVVLVLGMAYGWRLGAATLGLYLAAGAFGLPVFSGTPEKGIGVAYLLGPTGGYLLGMWLGAAVTGWLAERGWDRNVLTAALAMVVGHVLIYANGIAWLGHIVGWDKPVLEWGLYPFLLGDAIKILLAALTMPFVWRGMTRGR